MSTIIKDNAITEVQIVEETETEKYAEEAINRIPARIIKENSIQVDVISEATRTSNGIIDAVKATIEVAQ